MPHWVDTALVLAFALAYPVMDLARTPAIRRSIEAGNTRARLAIYRQTVLYLWAMSIAVLLWWRRSGRPFEELGLGLDTDWRFWIGSAVCLAAAVFLMIQPRLVAGNDATRAQLAEAFRGVEWFLPHDRGDLRVFDAMSVTAGITEEILYRGFLMWYLALLTNDWVAVPVSAVLFGFAHVYLGRSHALRSALVGLIFAALYLFTGSLWPLMILHVAIDLGSGRIAVVAMQERAAEAESPLTR